MIGGWVKKKDIERGKGKKGNSINGV